MRWSRPGFALFAVIALAAAVFIAAPPATADPTVETTVGIFWRDQADRQPEGDTPVRFFIAVIADTGSARPLGTVSVRFDGSNSGRDELAVKAVPENDALAKSACGDDDVGRCSITDDFPITLGSSPHFFRTDFSGDATFKADREDLAFARATLIDDPPDRSGASENVTYTMHLLIWKDTPADRKPTGLVDFSDTQGNRPVGDCCGLDSTQRARWTARHSPGDLTVTANYPGDDVYLPVRATKAHRVAGPDPVPGPTTPVTTTPPRTTTTRRTLSRTTPTTSALAPINPNPATTVPGDTTTTVPGFGDFVTSAPPPTTGNLSAASSDNNDEGAPVAVVATTLLALAGLGGVAAFRRYKRGGADWF